MEAPARGVQGLRVWPTSAWGRWAVGFAAAFFPLVALFAVFIATGPKGETSFTFTPQLIPGLLAVASAVAAVVAGLVATVKGHDRSLLTFVAIAFGGMVSFFLIGEFFIPPFD